MSKKLPPDIRAMSPTERGCALEQLRSLVRAALLKRGNHACWIHLMQASATLPEFADAGVTRVCEQEWMARCQNFWEGHPNQTGGVPIPTLLANCRRYYRRQPGGMGPAIPAIPCPFASKS